jgi:hypothetical protein
MNGKNERKRERLPSPDWEKISARIAPRDKVRIARAYDKRLTKGERSEDILGDLSEEYRRNARTIQRYISEGREILATKREMEKLGDIQLQQHFDRLAQTAGALASNINKLVKKGSLEARKDLILKAGGIDFVISSEKYGYVFTRFTGSEGGLVNLVERETWKPIRERDSETEDIDDHSADYLLRHFNEEFPDLAMGAWTEIALERASSVVDSLQLLAKSSIKLCPTCSVCQRITNKSLRRRGT